MMAKLLCLVGALALAACSSSSTTSSSGSSGSAASAGSTGSSASSGSSGLSGSGGSTASSSSGSSGTAPPLPAGMTVASGFQGATIAQVPGARELAALPNGDLLVGTSSSVVYLVHDVEGTGAARAPIEFITLSDAHASGVAYADGFVYIAAEQGIWKVPYQLGDEAPPHSAAVRMAQVRTGQVAPGSDGDVHVTTSIAVGASKLYVSVGSSCNACTEVDPTRAVILQMDLDGSNITTLATRIRNAIALAVNPATGTLWAGGAGQDNLPVPHPYEFMDPVTLRAAPADYGWPECEEDHVAYVNGADCTGTIAPALEFTAYATHVGAVFYPQDQTGAYAFPTQSRGLYVANHGSWHANPATPPTVDFVRMNGDVPAVAVNWSDPTAQVATFLGGMGTTANTHYLARPTGIAVGAQGSLLVADDKNGAIYRIRPIP